MRRSRLVERSCPSVESSSGTYLTFLSGLQHARKFVWVFDVSFEAEDQVTEASGVRRGFQVPHAIFVERLKSPGEKEEDQAGGGHEIEPKECDSTLIRSSR